MLAVFGEQRDRVESRSVMMQLPLKPPVLAGKDEIPITTSASVVSPVRDGGIVAEDCVESNVRLVVVAEIFRPRVDLFLSSRVPGHFASIGIGLGFPAIGTLAHLRLEVSSLAAHLLAF